MRVVADAEALDAPPAGTWTYRRLPTAPTVLVCQGPGAPEDAVVRADRAPWACAAYLVTTGADGAVTREGR